MASAVGGEVAGTPPSYSPWRARRQHYERRARPPVLLLERADIDAPFFTDLAPSGLGKQAQALSLPRGWTIRRDRLNKVDLRAS